MGLQKTKKIEKRVDGRLRLSRYMHGMSCDEVEGGVWKVCFQPRLLGVGVMGGVFLSACGPDGVFFVVACVGAKAGIW